MHFLLCLSLLRFGSGFRLATDSGSEDGMPCCNSVKCLDYKGKESVTETGRECAPTNLFGDATREDSYCRNEMGTEVADRPWCYDLSGKKKSCSVPQCDESLIVSGDAYASSEAYVLVPPVPVYFGSGVTTGHAIQFIRHPDEKCPRNNLLQKSGQFLKKTFFLTEQIQVKTIAMVQAVSILSTKVGKVEENSKVSAKEQECRRQTKTDIDDLEAVVDNARRVFDEISAKSSTVTHDKFLSYQELEKKIQDHFDDFDAAVATLDDNLRRMMKRLKSMR